MPATILYKSSVESRKYHWDFSANSTTPTSRGTTWSVAIFDTNETFEAALTLPLLLSLVQTTSAVTTTVTRDDGQASDLTLGTASIAGTKISMQVSGGTAGRTYTITVSASTNLGNVLAGQGQLAVVSTLPN